MKGYFFIFILYWSALSSEIEKISFTWDSPQCDARCARQLETRLKALRNVASVDINVSQGKGDVYWKSEQPFDFRKFETELRLFGLRMRDISIKMRGTISHSGDTFYVKSIGDNTKAELLSAPQPSASQYVELHNIYGYRLSRDLQKKYLDAESKHQVVTIEGPLFEPYRGVLRVIVTNTNDETTSSTTMPKKSTTKSPY